MPFIIKIIDEETGREVTNDVNHEPADPILNLENIKGIVLKDTVTGDKYTIQVSAGTLNVAPYNP